MGGKGKDESNAVDSQRRARPADFQLWQFIALSKLQESITDVNISVPADFVVRCRHKSKSTCREALQTVRLLSFLFAVLVAFVSTGASAFLEDNQNLPELTMIPVDMSIRVLDMGYGAVLVVDDPTGMPIRDYQGRECSGPGPEVAGRCASQFAVPAVVVAVIVGAGSGALGVAAGGGNAGQVLSGAILGGVAGFYGAIAGVATGISRVLYGTYSAIYGGGAVGLVGRTDP